MISGLGHDARTEFGRKKTDAYRENIERDVLLVSGRCMYWLNKSPLNTQTQERWNVRTNDLYGVTCDEWKWK